MDFIDGITAISAMDNVDNISSREIISNTSSNHTFISLMNNINTDIKTAETMMTEFALGNSKIEVHDLMISLEAAKMSLQTSVEIRNKLVESYKQITSMQV